MGSNIIAILRAIGVIPKITGRKKSQREEINSLIPESIMEERNVECFENKGEVKAENKKENDMDGIKKALQEIADEIKNIRKNQGRGEE